VNLDEYQQEVLRTTPRGMDAYPASLRAAARLLEAYGRVDELNDLLKTFDQLIWCLGLAGEVGETLDLLKKHFGHGKPLDLDKLKKELGDVRWYGAALEHSFGFKSSDVALTNISKLRSRYPTGFSVAAAAAKADERIEKSLVPYPHDGTGASIEVDDG
jgi:NTP pyrophosphatase (non-canonical NTP hydrolase)